MVIYIEILVAITFILEAGLEKTVIDLKNTKLPNYPLLNKREHKRSALWAIFYMATIAVAILNWLFFFSALVSRRLFFDYPLKLFRGRPFKNIEGDQFIDNTIRRILGPEGGYIELVIIFIVKTIILYFLLK